MVEGHDNLVRVWMIKVQVEEGWETIPEMIQVFGISNRLTSY